MKADQVADSAVGRNVAVADGGDEADDGRGGGKVGRKLGGEGPGAPVVGGALGPSEQQGPAGRVRLRVQDLEVGMRLCERVDDVLGPVVKVYAGTVASLSGTDFKSVTAFWARRKSRASLLPLVASIEPARTVKSWP